MTDLSGPIDPATAVVSLGRPPRENDGSLNPSITLTSTYHGALSPAAGERVYARFANPSWDPLEEAVATLEGSGIPGVAFASGMAAVASVFSLVPIGGIAVVPSSSYSGTIGLARQLHANGALRLREVDPTQVDETVAAMEGADLVWLESPTNPMLDVLDLTYLVTASKAAGAIAVVDNTFATPLRQRPFEFGADIVVHSATKFISGHSDVILGLALARDEEIRGRLHSYRTLHGAIPGPFEAWLALRGLRTLAVRLDRAESNAAEIASRLMGSAEISRVRYPGLAGDPGHQLAVKQMTGFGALVSIEFVGEVSAAERFVTSLSLITPATSLGGVETLAERRRRQPAEPVQVPASLVRLSFGIEHVEDLWRDISAALAKVASA